MDIAPHFKNLLDCLALEKQEDLTQYKTLLATTSVQQRRAKGLTWYPLQILENGYGLGSYPFLLLQRPEGQGKQEHSFASGKVVELFSNQNLDEYQSITATIQFVEGNNMKISTQANEWPDWVSEGKIGVNISFDEKSYEVMTQAVKKIATTNSAATARLRDTLLGLIPQTNTPIHYDPSSPALNPSQNLAVIDVLSQDCVSLIHGPPGTGKTTTLTHAIKHLCKTHKTILVCSPSNAACDLLAVKLHQLDVNVVRIGNLSRMDEEVLALSLQGKVDWHPIQKQIRDFRMQANEYKRLAIKYKRSFGKSERDQRQRLLTEAREIRSHIRSLEQEVIDNILSEAQVFITTLVSADNRYIENRHFPVVIIDEAAQALEPATWIPILKSQKVVLAGDPYQLPPTVKSQQAAKMGLTTTLLEKGIHALAQVNLLDTQYRMNSSIMGFSNQYFYQGRLKAHPSVADSTLGIIEDQPLTFIDTAGASFEEVQAPSLSYYNPKEAKATIKILSDIFDQVRYESLSVSIGIISPYKEQVEHIKSLYTAHSGLHDPTIKVQIATVDSFQGQERDVIIISLVRSNHQGNIGFLADYRRMNVAMTRARKKLVIIGDSATLASDDFYRQCIDYIEAQGLYRSIYELGSIKF